jgi:integrase
LDEIMLSCNKSKQPRTVAISPQIVDVLRWHRLRQHERQLAHETWHAHGIVFDRGDGRFTNLTTWQRFHRKLCERAGVPVIRAHDLRHSYATALMEANVHPRIVADILGHSTVQMTLDRYSHVSTSMQRAALDAIDDVIGEAG